MASPAIRSLLKSKLPLIRGTALASHHQPMADAGIPLVNEPIFFSSKVAALPPPPHQSFVFIGKDTLLGGGKASALGRICGAWGEGGVRLAGGRSKVPDEDEESEEMEDEDFDDSDYDDDLNGLDDSDDDDADEEVVPRSKSR